MNLLALEFSSHQRSVAILREGNPRRMAEEVETGPGANQALGMVQKALAAAACEREQVEVLAVGLGPGSYTGIRAAVSLAQGWELARGVKLLGISSVECIVAQAAGEGLGGRMAVVIDAQRGEFYLAGYEIENTETWRELSPLRIVPAAEVEQEQARAAVLIGPEVTKWFPSGRLTFPRATTLALLALRRTDFVQGDQLEPIYLRQTTFVKAPPPRLLPDA